KPECEISEYDASFATQSIADNGKSQKESRSVSTDSDVLHCVDQSKSSDTKEPHRNMPPKEGGKCGDIASSCFNYQDGVAVLGRHNCNYDTQVQLRLPRPVGKYEKREGELYSASLYEVNKKSPIRLEAEIIDRIVVYLEGCSVVGVHKCLYHFDNLSMLLSNTVSGIEKFAPGRRKYLFLHQRNGTRLRHFTAPYPKRGQSAFTAIVASGEKLCLPSVSNQAGTNRARKEKVLDLNRADDINELFMR
ncbi:hypothetical protein Plec18170_002198, partial [Paecilomyces lecythidis]